MNQRAYRLNFGLALIAAREDYVVVVFTCVLKYLEYIRNFGSGERTAYFVEQFRFLSGFIVGLVGKVILGGLKAVFKRFLGCF